MRTKKMHLQFVKGSNFYLSYCQPANTFREGINIPNDLTGDIQQVTCKACLKKLELRRRAIEARSDLTVIYHSEYIVGICTHDQYYRQYINKEILDFVCKSIGKDKIMTSKDKNFNDIPLKYWDYISKQVQNMCDATMHKLGEVQSLSTGVCIAKAAAKLIRNTEKIEEVIHG